MFSTIPLKIGPSTCHITSKCWICLLWALYLRCDGICVQSPMIPRLVQLCFSNLHILKGKWLPFQMVYADSPSCTSESRDSPSNCMYFSRVKTRSHTEKYPCFLLMIFVNFEHTKCALKLHISFFEIPYYEGQ